MSHAMIDKLEETSARCRARNGRRTSEWPHRPWPSSTPTCRRPRLWVQRRPDVNERWTTPSASSKDVQNDVIKNDAQNH
eukprot:2603638-Heterocapsa_arctica.AAC.1